MSRIFTCIGGQKHTQYTYTTAETTTYMAYTNVRRERGSNRRPAETLVQPVL